MSAYDWTIAVAALVLAAKVYLLIKDEGRNISRREP